MGVVGLVLLAVLGPGLVWRVLFRRSRRDTGTGDATPDSVAVLLVARDREGGIVDAVAAAARVVPGGPVHVVSSGSADRTAELADAAGATVVETLGTLGTGAAVAAGVAAFRLTERYSFVLVLDVDTRLPDGYLERALPLFGDPEVGAVDAAVAPDWLPPRRTLAAYRSRRTVLAHAAGRSVPAVGRVYRASVLDEVEPREDTAPGVPPPARVAVCPGPPAVIAASISLSEHRKRTRREVAGLWAVWRHRRAQVAELVTGSAVVALVPLAAVALAVLGGPVGPLWPVLALVAGTTC